MDGSERLVIVSTGTLVAGSGLVAGVFLAFSSFVMAALREQPPADAIRTMQAINRTVINPVVMTLLFGTAVVGVVAAVAAVRGGTEGRWLVVTAAGLYVIGVVGVTVAANVPLNDGLARVTAGSDDPAGTWAGYAGPWTRWNTVRTAFGIAASVAGLAGLLLAARGAAD